MCRHNKGEHGEGKQGGTALNPVEKLVLDHPPANALNMTVLRGLLGEIKKMDRDPQIRVVHLQSGNPYLFSSGLDLNGLLHTGRWRTALRIYKAERLVYRIVRAIRRSKKLYIAELNGSVIGSAASIALACDFRMGNQDVWFWCPDPKYGGLLADGGLLLLRDSVGLENARKLCLSMERIQASDALAYGCLHRMVDRDALTDTVHFFASELTSRSAISLCQTKRMLNRPARLHFPYRSLARVLCSKEMIQRLRDACRHDTVKHGKGVNL